MGEPQPSLTILLLSIPRPKVRASTESHCRSSDSGISGVYSGSSGCGSGKSNNCSLGVGGQDWRRQHQVQKYYSDSGQIIHLVSLREGGMDYACM